MPDDKKGVDPRKRRVGPEHFSRLSPFLPYCDVAVPIFMYHKIGRRPRGVIHRSTYLSDAWFRRQMRELKAAGFASISLDQHRDFGKTPRRCVLTFDDGSRTVLKRGAPLLGEMGFRGIQYLVASQIGGCNAWDVAEGEVRDDLINEAEIRDWMAMGHEIGSHTVSHPHLTEIPVAQAREEIVASKARLEDLFGVPIRHFCYPYGSWNRAVRDLVEEAGYETATVTVPRPATADDDPFALPRVGARNPKRNARSVLQAIWDFVCRR